MSLLAQLKDSPDPTLNPKQWWMGYAQDYRGKLSIRVLQPAAFCSLV